MVTALLSRNIADISHASDSDGEFIDSKIYGNDELSGLDRFNIVKENICSKNKGSCIDLILTNRRYSFKYTSSTETGLSDHHHLISSAMKTTFAKEESKVLLYRDYKKFNFGSFKSELLYEFHHNNVTFTSFENNFVNVLNLQAHKKSKAFCGNQRLHLNKLLKVAIIISRNYQLIYLNIKKHNLVVKLS